VKAIKTPGSPALTVMLIAELAAAPTAMAQGARGSSIRRPARRSWPDGESIRPPVSHFRLVLRIAG
jgi:hypothetical protein